MRHLSKGSRLVVALFVPLLIICPSQAQSPEGEWETSYIDEENIGTIFAVNSFGAATGRILDDDESYRAAIWTYGTPALLPQKQKWEFSEGEEINDAGVIVGAASEEPESDTLDSFPADRFPVVWSPDGTITVLPTFDGNGEALAINNDGVIGGWARDDEGTPRPVLWENGELVYLDTPDDPQGDVWSVNDDGMAAGWTMNSDNVSQATVWIDGEPTTLELGSYRYSTAYAVGPDGMVAGVVLDVEEATIKPVVWIDTELYVLDTGRANGGGEAVGVSGDGIVIGNGEDGDEVIPMVWRYDADEDEFVGEALEWGESPTISYPQDINQNYMIVGAGRIDDRPHGTVWSLKDD
jgi:hypothetical protein